MNADWLLRRLLWWQWSTCWRIQPTAPKKTRIKQIEEDLKARLHTVNYHCPWARGHRSHGRKWATSGTHSSVLAARSTSSTNPQLRTEDLVISNTFSQTVLKTCTHNLNWKKTRLTLPLPFHDAGLVGVHTGHLNAVLQAPTGTTVAYFIATGASWHLNTRVLLHQKLRGLAQFTAWKCTHGSETLKWRL